MIIDIRVFAVINTTDYNSDTICSIDYARGVKDCEKFGWNYNEPHKCYGGDKCKYIGEMNVGDIVTSLDYNGAYLMRIA